MSNSVLKYTDVRDIKKHVQAVTAAFDSGKTRSIEWRKAQIKQLGFMVQDNEVSESADWRPSLLVLPCAGCEDGMQGGTGRAAGRQSA
jgi:hypothetical protein